MPIFTVTSDRVQFTTEAVDAGDTFIGGIRFKQNGHVRATTDASTNFNGAIPQTDSGQVCLVDATAELPSGTVFSNGLPISGAKLCYSTDSVASYSNGLPYVANGAIAATITA